MEDYPRLNSRIGTSASIIDNPSFENAVVKVQRKLDSELNQTEMMQLRPFVIPGRVDENGTINTKRLSLSERSQKKNENYSRK